MTTHIVLLTDRKQIVVSERLTVMPMTIPDSFLHRVVLAASSLVYIRVRPLREAVGCANARLAAALSLAVERGYMRKLSSGAITLTPAGVAYAQSPPPPGPVRARAKANAWMVALHEPDHARIQALSERLGCTMREVVVRAVELLAYQHTAPHKE